MQVKIIEHSVSASGKEICTYQIKTHRFILPEINTHRVFSRNYSSSRAIPTKKYLETVADDPAIPVFWGKNKSGMQATEEIHVPSRAEYLWRRAAKIASIAAGALAKIELHKQIVNRVVEPFVWAHGVITTTEIENWNELRNHPDAQPEIQLLAQLMHEAREASTPKFLKPGEWHLPYVTEDEHKTYDIDLLLKISTARCCRVSYLKHDNSAPSIEDDLQLFDRLASARPRHLSPLEHQATPMLEVERRHSHIDGWGNRWSGNFKEWLQYRQLFIYDEEKNWPTW